ncbi:MAG: hypothetical protein KDA68_21575, partial [Planctomycetaceae bacterium]|nr:hypothetical protein [Planctomycetaceae bacterium]
NRTWDVGVDSVTFYGNTTDTPLIGNWRPKASPGSPPPSSLSSVLASSILPEIQKKKFSSSNSGF